jgi:tetratricopeptide (TPR) repeat protein
LISAGCRPSSPTSATEGQSRASSADASGQERDELFAFAVTNLNRLEEFDSGQMLEQILKRWGRPEQAKLASAAQEYDPLLASCPQPNMLREITNRMRKWAATQTPPDWKPDPLLATLPPQLAGLPAATTLDSLQFVPSDGYGLEEAVWLRDLSNWARGPELDDLQRASRLFDWTVRNIQLEPNDGEQIPKLPWETLLWGCGTASERAWVYLLLLRQQGIDAGILAIADATAGSGASVQAWCAAVLVEGKLYLFDTSLGLPIPAPDGIQAGRVGQLEIRPATLDQVLADSKLLRRLDLDAEHPYPVNKLDRKRLVMLVEGSPLSLSRRAKLVEARLVGKQKMVLTASPTAQAQRLQAAAHASGSRLWPLPFAALRRRSELDARLVERRLVAMIPFYAIPAAPLHQGRILHLKGQFVAEPGAIQCYQNARLSLEEIGAAQAKHAQEYFAAQFGRTSAADRDGAQPLIQVEARALAETEARACLIGKQNASYWLGLIAYEQGNYASAVDYFTKRTMEAMPNGPWTHGARYNLARTYEALGQGQKAVDEYAADLNAPNQNGNLLRARWLSALLDAAQARKAAEKKAAEKKAE